MKKVLAILCALAMTASCLSASMFAFAAENFAATATPFVDSVHDSWGAEPSTMIDDQLSTRWQAKNEVGGSNPVYVGLAWDTAITADTFIFYWEASYPGEDYEIWIATSPAALAEMEQTRFNETCYTEGTTAWTQAIKDTDFTAVRAEATGGPSWMDTITFSEPVTIYAIKYVCKSAGNSKNKNMSCHEIYAYNYAAGVPYDVSVVNNAIAYAEKVDATVGANALAVENFNAVLADAKAAVAACDGQTIGTVDGFVTQEDLDALAGEIFNAAVNLSGTGVIGENVLEGAMMFVNPDDMQGYADANNYFTLTDGSWETNTNCWQPKTSSTPLYLVLKTPAAMNEIVMYAESAAEEYKISYTTASVASVKSIADMEALAWTDIEADRIYASTAGDPTEQHYAFETVENVVAIRLECVVANLGAFAKLREVEAYNDTTFATEVKALADTENNRAAYLTVIDRADVTGGKKVYANFTVTFDGKTSVQKVEVKSSFQSVTLGETTYTAKDFAGEKVGYVTGIVLEGVTAEYDISEVVFTIE